MKMLLFSTSAIAVRKGPRNEEKKGLIKLCGKRFIIGVYKFLFITIFLFMDTF